jgi:hypothetical protein
LVFLAFGSELYFEVYCGKRIVTDIEPGYQIWLKENRVTPLEEKMR